MVYKSCVMPANFMREVGMVNEVGVLMTEGTMVGV